MKTIKEESRAELVVKKSKFIANAIPVESKEEAEQKIEEIKKKYHDAKHNCYAFVVENFEKCSDDGEPSKTAGTPILEIIKKKELENVLVTVTRYFGGILLGTGGLLRAYASSAQEAIEKAEIVDKEKGISYIIKINYENQKNVIYWCKKLNINIINTKYDKFIELQLESTKENQEKLLNTIEIEQNCEIINENIYIESENL